MLKTLKLNYLECTVVSVYVLIVYLVPKLNELQHSLQSVASQSPQLAYMHQHSWSIALWSIATIAFLAWAYSYRNARLISNIPTSKIGSASQGYVEIQGTIQSSSETLLTSPSGTKCVWYSVKHYEANGDSRSYFAELLDIDWLLGLFKSREGYALIGEHASKSPIQIEDNTGACWVLPEDARVFTKHTKISHPNSLYRFEEQLLYPDTKIYVLGDFSSESKPLPKMDAQQETVALLETWQQDEASFKQKFDANKDGLIDLKEWESARKQAHHEVKTKHDNIKKESQQHYISQPLYGEHFIISETAPNTIHQHFLGWATLHFIVMVTALYIVNTSNSYQEFKQIISGSNTLSPQAKQTNQNIENTPTDLSALEPAKSALDE
jgi:hypothetical protein